MPKSEKISSIIGSPLNNSPNSSDLYASPLFRYEAEFVEQDVIGSGHFGRVTKVLKRLDGVTYAIKRTQEERQKTSL